MPGLPLDDIKVVDITNMINGPNAALLLAEFGADVIHVEAPWGDDGRNSTTPFLEREGIIYNTCNRSKRDIVVDMRKEEGREVIRRLVQVSDVLVENLAAGGMERMGLGYEALSQINPGLVYAYTGSYGSKGPMAHLGSYDVVIQGWTGRTVTCPHCNVPLLAGVVSDTSAPLLLVYGIMLALRHRDRTGRGQKVETSLLHGALQMDRWGFLWTEQDPANQAPPQPQGRRRGGVPGLSIVETADGHMVVCAWRDPHWVRLCKLLGLDHLGEDPRYATRPQRAAAHEELTPVINSMFIAKTTEEWLASLMELDIPCAPINPNSLALRDHPQLRANDMLVEVEHPTKGRMIQLSALVQLSETPAQVKGPAPLMGQHTDEVLAEIGYSLQEIADLRASGVVA